MPTKEQPINWKLSYACFEIKKENLNPNSTTLNSQNKGENQ